MSDTEEYACSQEIENSSNSTRNSKRRRALSELILKNGAKSLDRESINVVTCERFPRLPLLKKRDYIENWILCNRANFSNDSTDQSSQGSSRLGIGQKKRVPGSPVLGNGWKRARVGDVGTKENSRLRYNKESAEWRKNEDSSGRERVMSKHLQHDSMFNIKRTKFRTFSSTLETSPISQGISCSTTSRTSLDAKATRRQARVRETSKMSKFLSISSPLVDAESAKLIEAIEPRADEVRKDDRLVCRFSWHRKNSGTRRSMDLSGKSVESLAKESVNLPEVNQSDVRIENRSIETSYPKEDSVVGDRERIIYRDIRNESCTQFEGETPLRWNGYENLTLEPAERDKKTLIADQDEISLRNFSPSDKRNNVKFQAESPLRWKGYEIPESIIIPETMLLNSPIIGRERTIQSSSTSDIKADTIFDHRKSIISENSSPIVEKNCQKFEAESPLRWNGYQNEIRDNSKLSNTPVLSSTMYEPERIIQSSSTNDRGDDHIILDDQSTESNFSQGEIKENRKTIEAVSPLRWNGYGSSSGSCKLPSVALSSPLMESELHVIGSCSSGDTRYCTMNDEERELKSRDSRLRCKKLPIKLETIFNLKNHQGEISQSSILTDTRETSTPPMNTEDIDAESLTALDEDTKIDDETESLSNLTVSDVIENVPTQKSGLSKLRKCSIISRNKENDVTRENSIERGSKTDDENDSDETYCSDIDPVRHSPRKVIFSQKKSQNFADSTINGRALTRNKSDLISQTSSPLKNNVERPIHVTATSVTRNTSKRTKKAKKGSLVAKLQSLVSLQVSNLQIWQYQMSRLDLKNLRTQFVKLTIRERETRYGRHFLTAKIVEDSHNLLKNLYVNDDKSLSEKKQIVTLVIVPEINGTTKIRDDSIVRIYPPWEIMDQVERVLSIIYFDVVTKKEESNVITERLVENKRVLEKFECPCIRRGAIDLTCPVKFTNTKPSVMQAMFGPAKII